MRDQVVLLVAEPRGCAGRSSGSTRRRRCAGWRTCSSCRRLDLEVRASARSPPPGPGPAAGRRAGPRGSWARAPGGGPPGRGRRPPRPGRGQARLPRPPPQLVEQVRVELAGRRSTPPARPAPAAATTRTTSVLSAMRARTARAPAPSERGGQEQEEQRGQERREVGEGVRPVEGQHPVEGQGDHHAPAAGCGARAGARGSQLHGRRPHDHGPLDPGVAARLEEPESPIESVDSWK